MPPWLPGGAFCFGRASRARRQATPPATPARNGPELGGAVFLAGAAGHSEWLSPDRVWPTNPHTIDRWDDATGENLIEQIAAVGDYLVALETYRAAVKRWPKDKITLRNRARVIEKTWED